jgi:hypothetical protein
MRALLILILLGFTALTPAAAEIALAHAQVAKVCAGGSSAPPTKFEGCVDAGIGDVDPQGRDIWVVATINAPEGLPAGTPLGLFVSAKASSEAYLNGVRLGANGAPATTRALETPGRMDTVFAIPPGLVRDSSNQLLLRMSSHRGVLHLARPVHVIAIAEYGDPTGWIFGQYGLPLVTFGALIAGAFYFAASAATGERRMEPALLASLSFFAAGQLIVEAWRGLFPYAYPVHDWRLLLIVAMSFGFGLSLAAVIVWKFMSRRRLTTLAAIGALSAMLVVLAGGFDLKAAAAILVPALASFAIAARAAWNGTPQAALHAAALGVFTATIIIFPSRFLDALFFLEVTALILVFFIAEAFAFARERRERELESARAHDLQAALERAAARDVPPVVRVNAAGSLSIIRADEIAYCKGAGDYVELHLGDGRVILHNGALADMERDLPGSFLRVHRSFLVNTDFARSLTRESTGVGALSLSTGAEIPVSRRIMPKVRSALG